MLLIVNHFDRFDTKATKHALEISYHFNHRYMLFIKSAPNSLNADSAPYFLIINSSLFSFILIHSSLIFLDIYKISLFLQ